MRSNDGWSRFYRRFVSLKTTVVFLGLLTFFYLLGTLFPQGRQYASGKGWALSIAKFLDLLHLFSSPPFLIVTLLFTLHLILCNYNRWQLLWRRSPPSVPLDRERLYSSASVLALPVHATVEMVEKALEVMGFRRRDSIAASGLRVVERGWSPQWLSLIYHIALCFCLLGFFVTFLFAYEGEITLYPHQLRPLPAPSQPPRWSLGHSRPPSLVLELRDFLTEYTEVYRLDYPSSFLDRLALILGLPVAGRRSAPDPTYFPKDWKSHLVVYYKQQPIKEKVIEVNDPLDVKGLTFYQMAYSQELRLRVSPVSAVGRQGETLSIKAEERFQLPGLPGYFKTGPLYLGKLYKRDGSVQEIVPWTPLYYYPAIKDPGSKKAEKPGKLVLHRPLQYRGLVLTLTGYQEASILSYRHDPGRPWLWLASVSLLIFMTLRIWGGWYRLIYWLEGEDGRLKLCYVYQGIGLGAEEARFLRRFRYLLNSF